MAEDKGCTLADLSPSDLRTIHPLFEGAEHFPSQQTSMRIGSRQSLLSRSASATSSRCRAGALTINADADDVSSVWDFDRSAELRDTEGGSSRRSVLEQVDKIKSYLAAEGLT